jgi:hypothetical protein
MVRVLVNVKACQWWAGKWESLSGVVMVQHWVQQRALVTGKMLVSQSVDVWALLREELLGSSKGRG